MKWLSLIGLGVISVLHLSCGGGAANPTDPLSEPFQAPPTAVATESHTSSGPTLAPPCATPTPEPVAIFSVSQVLPTCPSPGQGTLTAIFNVNPQAGPPPLPVVFNMCKSFDTDPTVTLKFKVDFGDGGSDQGNCYLANTYQNPGAYTATACVSDRILTHPPVCQPFTINVASTAPCTVAFSNLRQTCKGNGFAVDAMTAGSGSCGQPLTAQLSQPSTTNSAGFTLGGQGACPPGSTCTLLFLFPPPPPGVCSNGCLVAPNFSPYVVTGLNAQGSATFPQTSLGPCF